MAQTLELAVLSLANTDGGEVNKMTAGFRGSELSRKLCQPDLPQFFIRPTSQTKVLPRPRLPDRRHHAPEDEQRFAALQCYAAAAERSDYKAHRELTQGCMTDDEAIDAAMKAVQRTHTGAKPPVQNEANPQPANAKKFQIEPGENLALRL